MVFGFAPGYVARTTMVGGTTSGYSLIGNRTMAINPTMKMIIESTPAKIGRRMKKCEKFIEFTWFEIVVTNGCTKAPSSKTTARLRCLRLGVGSFSGAWSVELGAFSWHASRVVS